jgi:hypothetical protein
MPPQGERDFKMPCCTLICHHHGGIPAANYSRLRSGQRIRSFAIERPQPVDVLANV